MLNRTIQSREMTPSTTRDFPTINQSHSYQELFDYYNAQLFRGELPPCILNFSRHKNAYGFFAPERWQSGVRSTHEISLNPDYLSQPPIETMSTLVHEMVHLWQHVYGKPSRSTYHNCEWANKMESIGLIPSDTGQPGGKKTGNRVSEYIAEDGDFAIAFNVMPKDYLLPWKSAAYKDRRKSARKQKIKYSCPGCQVNVWGKPNLSILCGTCAEPFLVTG
jgi:predicted SprT family Zn-dependent metalloprotease